MEMKRMSGGTLRAIGYDPARRVLVAELTSGTFEYAGVSAETYRRLASSGSAWSFFRDNIEEEFPAKRIR
ncbi:MAG: KTSC domain-containing protein [Casimicrobiaceae bacterium]